MQSTHSLNCERVQHKSGANKARIDAKCAQASLNSSASKVSSFILSTEVIEKHFAGREAVLQKLSEKHVADLLAAYFVQFLNSLARQAHAYSS